MHEEAACVLPHDLEALYSDAVPYVKLDVFREGREAQFLVLVEPLVQTLISACAEYLKTQGFIDLSAVLAALVRDAHAHLLPMIRRCCLYEYRRLLDMGALGDVQAKEASQQFTQFIKILAVPEEAMALLNNYPDLKAQLWQYYQCYLASFTEFFHRLVEDVHDVIALAKCKPASQLIGLEYVGDGHNGLRRVVILKFSCGAKVLYKPRPIANINAYNCLIDWVNQFNEVHKLYPLNILLRDAYGWVEYIDQVACQDQSEIKSFYHQFGQLIALSYFCQLRDIHFENVIAHGSHPVIVDYECFLTPTLLLENEQTIFENQPHVMQSLLTFAVSPGKDCWIDVSGLTGGEEKVSSEESPMLDTDASGKMCYVRKNVKGKKGKNIALINGQEVDPTRYANEITAGFKAVYRNVLMHKRELHGLCSSWFKHCLTRVVIRDTKSYAAAMIDLFHPRLLRDAQARGAHLEEILNVFHIPQVIVESDIAQMMRGDVPLYYLRYDSPTIYDAYDKPLALSSKETSEESVRKTINNANEQDLTVQCLVIEQCLQIAKRNRQNKKSREVPAGRVFESPVPDQLVQRAQEILDYLYAYRQDTQALVWPISNQIFFAGEYYYEPKYSGVDLYGGNTGILLAFAYGYHLFGTQHYHDLLAKGVADLQVYLETLTAENQDFSLFSGLFGIVYFALVLRSLGLFQSQAEHLIDLIISAYRGQLDHWINQDDRFDLISGSVGIILVCCYGVTQDYSQSHFLEIAESAYQRILTCLRPLVYEKGHHPILLGLSHGASGIAYAFTQLSDHIRDPALKDFTADLLAYERFHYAMSEGGWPNYTESAKSLTPVQRIQTDWCHGSVGIGFVRWALYQRGYQDPALEYELSIVMGDLAQEKKRKFCNLCHGYLGTLELLQCLKSIRPELVGTYNSLLTRCLQDTASVAQINCDGEAGFFSPGLMTGLSGVAYQLMHLANPSKVPSILLL